MLRVFFFIAVVLVCSGTPASATAGGASPSPKRPRKAGAVSADLLAKKVEAGRYRSATAFESDARQMLTQGKGPRSLSSEQVRPGLCCEFFFVASAVCLLVAMLRRCLVCVAWWCESDLCCVLTGATLRKMSEFVFYHSRGDAGCGCRSFTAWKYLVFVRNGGSIDRWPQ